MLRVAVLCSRRAPALDVLLANRGSSYEVSCVISTHNATIEADVPVIVRPMFAPRRAYDRGTVEILQAFGADVVVLLGYCFILSDVVLDAFPGRIFSIHDSDLRLTRADGERRYIGLHSTLDAVRGGESETRSTLHVVTHKLDGGPILAVSRAYPVAPFVHEAAAAGHHDIVKAYAYAQREWMMRDSWGEMLVQALAAAEEAVA
jgi:folate-dependent phosphoribosylglycinamide formyltransferase PurN